MEQKTIHLFIGNNDLGKLFKCIVCKKEIPFNCVCLSTQDNSICMGCEFKKIDVWKVTLPNESSNPYYDTDISSIVDMLNECDYGEGYTVKKERIKATKYYSLPEFKGF